VVLRPQPARWQILRRAVTFPERSRRSVRAMGGTRSLQAGQRPVIAWWSLVVLNIVLFAVDVPLGFAARWAGQSYSL